MARWILPAVAPAGVVAAAVAFALRPRVAAPGRGAETARTGGDVEIRSPAVEQDRSARGMPMAESAGVGERPTGEGYLPLARFHEESDPEALMRLAATMRDNPRARADPDSVATMLEVARETEELFRREAAVMFLMGCEDPSGKVAAFLAEEIGAGTLDVSELPGFVELNPGAAALIHGALLDRAEAEPGRAAELLAGIYAPAADGGTIERIRRWTAAEDAETRAAAYEVVGRLPREQADAAWLERAWHAEAEERVRGVILLALARGGAVEALERIGTDEARLWAGVLREYPQHPFDYVREEVERRR